MTVDAYLSSLEPEDRRALAALRSLIIECLPDAEERIAYNIPSYSQGGPIVHFAKQDRHLALYGAGRDILERLEPALKAAGCKINGRTIKFWPETPIPADIVRQIIADRLAQKAL